MAYLNRSLRLTPEKESNRRFRDAGADRAIHMLPSEGEGTVIPMLEQWAAELL